MTGDVTRGAIATALTFGLLLATPPGSIAFWGLAGLTVLFALYLATSVSRMTCVVEVDEEGLRLRGGLLSGREIKWNKLQRFELRHFPVSRDRSRGWMDLKLTAEGRTIAIDDRLEGFPDVLARAWAAARAADIGISDATHHNLIATGLVMQAKA